VKKDTKQTMKPGEFGRQIEIGTRPIERLKAKDPSFTMADKRNWEAFWKESTEEEALATLRVLMAGMQGEEQRKVVALMFTRAGFPYDEGVITEYIDKYL
jgi:hypothetical protein